MITHKDAMYTAYKYYLKDAYDSSYPMLHYCAFLAYTNGYLKALSLCDEVGLSEFNDVNKYINTLKQTFLQFINERER